MISLYSGTPGSGKSLHVAKRIYHELRRNKPIIANFEINLKNIDKKKFNDLPFTYIDNLDMHPDILIEYAMTHINKVKKVKENSILLIIDECQLIFNSREWQMKGRKEWLSFFSQHRKYSYEIILVAQFDGMIDKQIRSLIEYNYIHRKVSNFGIIGRIMSLISLGSLFCAVKIWYPLNEKINSDFFKGNRKYYNIYNTYDFFTDPSKKEGS